ncbi:hypothetical protein QJS66_22575 [Kocuria rhizophila]|nr:hypothetical protein QJS66_22575 [Kocuria rhizophila]
MGHTTARGTTVGGCSGAGLRRQLRAGYRATAGGAGMGRQEGGACPPGGAADAEAEVLRGAMIAGMALAGLLGAGVAVGAGAVGTRRHRRHHSSPVIVNDTESVKQDHPPPRRRPPHPWVTISAASRQRGQHGLGVLLDEPGPRADHAHVVTLGRRRLGRQDRGAGR